MWGWILVHSVLETRRGPGKIEFEDGKRIGTRCFEPATGVYSTLYF
jgi:hypothetical protein